MPSLSQILADHAPLLLLDAASVRVQVGWFSGRDLSATWQSSEAEAGLGIFHCVEKLGVDLESVRGWAFCEGPGSVLGIRTVAMALRTWNVLSLRPVFAYGSLALVAQDQARPDATVIADARRGAWHCRSYATGAGVPAPAVGQVADLACRVGDPAYNSCRRDAGAALIGTRRVPTAELAGELLTPEGFRNWTPLPAGVERVSYDLAAILPRVAGADLFRAVDAPDAFLSEEPSYVSWTPRIHRAP